MKQVLFFLILVLLVSGCSVSRKTAVKEDIKVDVIKTVEKAETETTVQTISTDVVKEVTTSVTDKTITRVIETVYSKPDETGVQHKKTETVTETLNDIAITNEENERIISEQKNEIERLSSVNSELQTKLEASQQVTTKTSTKPPIWTYIVAFVLGSAVALCIRIWLKEKFRR